MGWKKLFYNCMTFFYLIIGEYKVFNKNLKEENELIMWGIVEYVIKKV